MVMLVGWLVGGLLRSKFPGTIDQSFAPLSLSLHIKSPACLSYNTAFPRRIVVSFSSFADGD
jgi:hypothetical protein